MPVQFDWEFTNAPDKEEGAKAAPILRPPVPATTTPVAQPRLRRHWPWWVYGLFALIVLVAGGLGAWGGFAYWRWTQFQADIILFVQNEEQAALQGNSDQVARLQDPNEPEWVQLRAALAQNYLPASLPLPTLDLVGDQIALAATHLWAEDLVQADIERHYIAPDGRTVYFSLPQFYRFKQGTWQRTPPPGSLWGTLEKWESPHLLIRYYAVDENLIQRLAPEIERLLAQACRVATRVCTEPAHLYLSASLVSLNYEPLSNVEVNLGIADEANSKTYYVSLPSPQLVGVPTDPTANELLAKYYALRLWVARALGANDPTTIAWVVDILGLKMVDPGFVARYSTLVSPSESILAPTPTPTATRRREPTPTPIPTYIEHTVREGDTLVGIAALYEVSVEAIVQVNSITDPNMLSIGQVLLIPRGAYP